MKIPPRAIGRLHQRALAATAHRTVASLQQHPFFIGAIDHGGPQNDLSAVHFASLAIHCPLGDKNIVEVVDAVDFGSFGANTYINILTFIQQLETIPAETEKALVVNTLQPELVDLVVAEQIGLLLLFVPKNGRIGHAGSFEY